MNPAIIVTSLRPFLAILFSYFFLKSVQPDIYNPDKTYFIISLTCVIFIELSDAIDGIIARKRNEVTRFGMIYDPICDSVSRQTIFCTFMVAGIFPLWMFLIFLYRDAVLSLLRIFCAIDGTVMAAKKSGKIKAVFQAVGIFLVLFVILTYAYDMHFLPKTLYGRHLGFWIILFPALFTVLSMFDYLIPNWHVLKKMASKTKL